TAITDTFLLVVKPLSQRPFTRLLMRLPPLFPCPLPLPLPHHRLQAFQHSLSLPQPIRAIFFFQAADCIRHRNVTGVQTCALPISPLSLRALRYAILTHSMSRIEWVRIAYRSARRDRGVPRSRRSSSMSNGSGPSAPSSRPA